MKKDDLKFLASLAATAALAGMVIYSAYVRDQRASAGPMVDVDKIEAARESGVIGFHDAEYWAPAEEGGQ